MAEVEITRESREGEVPPLRFFTAYDGHFRFGSRVEDMDIAVPEAQVSIGWSVNETIFVPPISIDAKRISFNTDYVVAKASPYPNSLSTHLDQSVSLKTSFLDAPRVIHRPILHGEIRLEVTGSDFRSYPWEKFVTDVSDNVDPGIDEALRRLKRILKLFRSHGRGGLAKYRHAIEHRRRTRGAGQLVLNQLLAENVLRMEGQMYYLNSTLLAEVVGLQFGDVRSVRTTPITTEFLKRALDSA